MMKRGQDLDGKVFRHFCPVVSVLRIPWCALFILQQQVIRLEKKGGGLSKNFTRGIGVCFVSWQDPDCVIPSGGDLSWRPILGKAADDSRHGDTVGKAWNLAICRSFLTRGNFKVFGNMRDNHSTSMLMKL